VIALYVLLAAAAASSPAGPSQQLAPVKTLSACSAVTPADLERAFGLTFGRGQEETHATESTCDYASGHGQVSITIQRLARKLDMPKEIEAMKQTIEGSSVRLAEGIGTTAFYLDIPSAGTQLHVIIGERNYLMVSVLGFGDASTVSAATEKLTHAALGRL
jgi:hypothetical protein